MSHCIPHELNKYILNTNLLRLVEEAEGPDLFSQEANLNESKTKDYEYEVLYLPVNDFMFKINYFAEYFIQNYIDINKIPTMTLEVFEIKCDMMHLKNVAYYMLYNPTIDMLLHDTTKFPLKLRFNDGSEHKIYECSHVETIEFCLTQKEKNQIKYLLMYNLNLSRVFTLFMFYYLMDTYKDKFSFLNPDGSQKSLKDVEKIIFNDIIFEVFSLMY